MILLGSQVGTPANWPVDSNFDTMMALKSMPSRYTETSVPENTKQFPGTQPHFFSKSNDLAKSALVKVEIYVKIVNQTKKRC